MWECLQERRWGVMAGKNKLMRAQRRAQRAVESAMVERELLTWAPLGGEAVVALRRRVEDFLGRLGKAVLEVEGEGEVRVVVAGHGHWMKELSWMVLGKMRQVGNTGVDTYRLTLTGEGEVEEVVSQVLNSTYQHPPG